MAYPVDLAGIWKAAGQYADAEINPQLAEIDRLLQEAGYTADESTRAINEAYPVARRSLQKSIYENMVAGEGSLAAMGTGRGGGRQELLARAGEREAVGLEGIETQRQRELGAIQRALASYRGQLGTQRTSLVGRRGALQSSYAEQLRGSRFNEAATRAGLDLSYAQLAENARQYNEQLAENARQYNAQLAEQQRQYNESMKAYTNQTTGGSSSDVFTGAGGTYYNPTIEEINALTSVPVTGFLGQTGIPFGTSTKYYGAGGPMSSVTGLGFVGQTGIPITKKISTASTSVPVTGFLGQTGIPTTKKISTASTSVPVTGFIGSVPVTIKTKKYRQGW
jgi:hypothetical protein